MAKKILEIMDRIKELKSFKKDWEVAEFLGMSKTAFSNHKTRGTIPYEKMSIASEHLGVHLDWILTGEGPKHLKKELTGEKMVEPSLARYDRTSPEIKQFINQVYRIYWVGDEISRAKLRILLAALDPGEKI